MIKITCNINRTGKIQQGGGSASSQPVIAEVPRQPELPVAPFEVHLIAWADGQLFTIGRDHIYTYMSGSVFALLCRKSSDGLSSHKDTFFIAQLIGISVEFEAPSGDLVRTAWLRLLSRPGQLGPYGHPNEMYALNVKLSENIARDEIVFLPAVDSLFTTPLATDQKYSTHIPAMTDSILYQIRDSIDGQPSESYQVLNGAFAMTRRLQLDRSAYITGDLIYNPVMYSLDGEASTQSAYARAPVLGLVALSLLANAEKPESADIHYTWSCLHKPSGSAALDSMLLLTRYTSKYLLAAVVAEGDSEEIVNFQECVFLRS